MDTARFDKLAKWFSRGHSRRTVLRGTLGGAAAAAAGPATWARAHQATPPVATPGAGQENWLLVVGFGGAALAPSTDNPGALTVTLIGVDRDAVAFTDRPQRQFVSVQPEQVVAAITGAAADPLNAALVARRPLSRESDQIGVVLRSASFDEDAGTLTLEVTVFGLDETGTPVAPTANQTTVLRGGNLFIDGVAVRETFGYSCGKEGASCLLRICCPGTHCLTPVYPYCVKL